MPSVTQSIPQPIYRIGVIVNDCNNIMILYINNDKGNMYKVTDTIINFYLFVYIPVCIRVDDDGK